ncbi:hypothetical protein QUR76_02565 [Arcobacter cryaerophilus gv. pseudocryaerophilus]|uniref:KAP NTPase domain-containing protein n=3 Tax=unclassified Arcobacter TaxID=2593671 RepID=A0AA96DSU0_9BACT|nr:hypothetical protein RMQ65_05530 [Arcobacter sp. AZ-2023]WPD06083.1 hypothetical protein QUR76_02565 [Arcobacter sp. DSM 115956]WPD08175.1 hypothetical protein QUR78_02565 [Arcobacter sp. DSM 115955]WNL32440.1 hypothetical protein RMQ67_02565 [Arcobacter sp. AZ-2023]WNP38590.1 hypothetical protein RJG58_02565 [Arcobacter sp. AZ-2023]
MSTSKEIYIPLEKSTNATKNFNLDNLIQLRSFSRLSQIILDNLDKINNKNNTLSDRYHETITLLGNRGSGKTSFLLNLESYIKSYNEDKFNDLCFLKLLDPTLFENKQNVVLTIITIILNHIQEQESNNLINNDFKDNFSDSLKSLARGLNLLDGINSNIDHKSIWDDDIINFNKGIQCSKDSIEFELLLKKFITVSLNYLNKKMFILMFDDIDTNISKGWPVLEVIRKYLTTLEIQVIVSGDWNLFSKLVRVKQLENLDGLRSIEKDYSHILDNLEEQYLTKILKPENRIMLEDLDTISKYQSIYVTYEKTTQKIQEAYSKIINFLFSDVNKSNQDYSKNIFFSIPLRSNLFILNSYFKNYGSDNINKLNFLNSLSKQFLTHLSKFNITFKDLNDLEEDTVIYSYLKKAKELNKIYKIDINDFFSLSNLNQSDDIDKNILFFILKGYLTVVIQNKPYLIIEWLYKVELFKYIKKDYISLDDDMKYLGYDSNISPFEFIVRLNGYMAFQGDEQNFTIPKNLIGFIGIYKDGSKQGNKSYDHFVSELSKIEDKESYSLISYFLFNHVISARGSRFHLFGSLYNIIGLLFDIIKVKSKGDNLVEYFQNKSVLTSIEPYNISKNFDTPINYHQNLSSINLTNAKIIKDLDSWLDKLELNDFSLNILSEIMKEYYFQLSEIPNCKSFGEYLTFNICYFLNAILKAETNYYSGTFIPINRIKRNYLDAISSLQTNVDKSKIQDYSNNKKTLFKFFYDCPIWNYLISLHGLQNNIENVSELEKGKEYTITSDLFSFNDVEETISTKEEKEIIDDASNKYYKLLLGLMIHQNKEDEDSKSNEDIEPESYETNFSKEKFLKIILENQVYLEKYKVSNKDQLTTEIINKYISIIKTKYKPKSKFAHGNRMEMLKEAILEFSEII